MIAHRPDKHGVVRLWYQRPPQAFIDSQTAIKVLLRDTFAGCRLTNKGRWASACSLQAWLDKRDEWSAE